MTLEELVVICLMKVVSKLPDGRDWQWRRYWSDWWRIAANDRDDLVAVDLESRMEADNYVVLEHSLWILLCSTSLQRKLDLVAVVALANDLTGTVTVEVCVGDTIKLLVEFQIHLFEETTANQ